MRSPWTKMDHKSNDECPYQQNKTEKKAHGHRQKARQRQRLRAELQSLKQRPSRLETREGKDASSERPGPDHHLSLDLWPAEL